MEEPNNPIRYSPVSPHYSPSTPCYSEQDFIPQGSTIVSFDLEESILQTINTTRNWGTLRWRNPNLGDRFWGHVYMPIDPKIVEIIEEYYGKKGLIGKVNELMNLYSGSYKVDYHSLVLPPHFTVISWDEWQHLFFELDKNITYFSVNNLSALTSPIEHSNSPYNSHSVILKEEKIHELMNFTYFTRSQFALSLPAEIISYIKEFLIVELKECGKKFNFSITGKVSYFPRYFGEKNGFFLHVESPELNELRGKYGFKEMDFVIPLGVCVYDLGNYSPLYKETIAEVKDFSKKRNRPTFESTITK